MFLSAQFIKSLMDISSTRTPTRRRTQPKRETTPNRTTAASLPDEVQAQLIKDLKKQHTSDPKAHKFYWHPTYEGHNRDKVRKRYYYYRDIKCCDSGSNWADCVEWADKFKADDEDKNKDDEDYQDENSNSQSSLAATSATTHSNKRSNRAALSTTAARMPLSAKKSGGGKPKAKEQQPSKSGLEEATAALEISSADGDIDDEIGCAEDCFLSMPYTKDVTRNGVLSTHTYYCILVLTHSEKDSKAVTATPKVDKNGAGSYLVRIIKPKYPSFLEGTNQIHFIESALEGHHEAAKGFSQSVFAYKGDRNATIVDVHFKNPIHPRVQKISEVHLELFDFDDECKACRRINIDDIANVTAFEVEEIRFTQTAQRTVEGARRRTKIRK